MLSFSRSGDTSDVAAELGLEGRPHELTMKVLNDNLEKLRSSVIGFTINSSRWQGTPTATSLHD